VKITERVARLRISFQLLLFQLQFQARRVIPGSICVRLIRARRAARLRGLSYLLQYRSRYRSGPSRSRFDQQ
jgi:hypothetical protein